MQIVSQAQTVSLVNRLSGRQRNLQSVEEGLSAAGLTYMQTDCQAARNDVRQADMLSGRETDCKAGT
jgi:hypothetical protein